MKPGRPRKAQTPKWIAKAQKILKTKEQRGSGYGRFALLTKCRLPTFSLHISRKAAEEAKRLVDSTGCGGKCPIGDRASNHCVVDLALFEKQE